jgi:hypothetical protein
MNEKLLQLFEDARALSQTITAGHQQLDSLEAQLQGVRYQINSELEDQGYRLLCIRYFSEWRDRPTMRAR